MTYAVIAPKKFSNQSVKSLVCFVSDDIDEAKKVAQSNRDLLAKKGFQSWANKVRLVSPNTPDAYIDLANQALEMGRELDSNSNGNSFAGSNLIDWSNTLRIRADELASPESYAA